MKQSDHALVDAKVRSVRLDVNGVNDRVSRHKEERINSNATLRRRIGRLEERVCAIDARTKVCSLCGQPAVPGTTYEMPGDYSVPWCGRCHVVDENMDRINEDVES